MSTYCRPRYAWSSVLAAACLAFSIPALSGCSGGNAGTVSGKVTLNGQPLQGGRLKLYSSPSADPYPISVGNDGTFSTVGVPPGEYKVTVESVTVANPMAGPGAAPPGMMTPEMEEMMRQGREKAKAEGKEYPMPGIGGGNAVTIPQQYTNPNTTTFSWTVTKGKNEPKEFAMTP
jgi:hypothetical protein